MTFEEELKNAIQQSNTTVDLYENILAVKNKYCLDKQKVKDAIEKSTSYFGKGGNYYCNKKQLKELLEL